MKEIFFSDLRSVRCSVFGHPVLTEDDVSRNDGFSDTEIRIFTIQAVRTAGIAILNRKHIFSICAARQKPLGGIHQIIVVFQERTGSAVVLSPHAKKSRKTKILWQLPQAEGAKAIDSDTAHFMKKFRPSQCFLR